VQPYILFVGRLKARKGCGWFIRNVLDSLPERIVLKIAATRIDPDEDAAINHPRVEFLGPVHGEDLARVRRAAIAVIVPNIDTGVSGFEGFGLVATEAAGDGGVTLAANLHGLRDAVIDGETGFLVTAGDADAWRNKLLDVASWSHDERTAFVRRATRQTHETYNWQRVAAQTKALYINALETRKTTSGDLERVA